MKLFELFDRSEATEVANELVAMFGNLGFTIEMDSHTIDRLVGRDQFLITKEQMLDTFKYLLLTQKRAFRPMRDKVASMIVKDSHNEGNYVLNFDNNHIKITTAMKKKNFQTSHDRQGSTVVTLGSHPSRAAPDAGAKQEDEVAPEDDMQSDADATASAEAELRAATAPSRPTITTKKSRNKVWPRGNTLTLGGK